MTDTRAYAFHALLLLFAAFLFGSPGAGDEAQATRYLSAYAQGASIPGLDSFDSDSIRHDGPDQWRWLSIPDSRLVLNPSLITERSAPLCTALALHVGFHEGAHPQRMQHLAALRVLDAGDRKSERHTWHQRLVPGRDWTSGDGEWAFHGAAKAADNALAALAVRDGGDPWGWASYTIAPPFLAKSGFIRIHVPRVEGAWALKIGHATLATDVYVQHDTQRPGVYIYDLSQIEGWQGLDAVDLKFFAVGNGAAAWLESIEIEFSTDDPAQGRATSVKSCWYPYQIAFEADYDRPAVTIGGRDFFHDEDTLVRFLDLDSREENPVTLCFEGRPHADTHRIFKDEGILSFSSASYSYALRFLRKTDDGGYVPVSITAVNTDYQWQVTIPIAPGKSQLALVASFSVGAGHEANVLEQLRDVRDMDASLQSRKSRWDAYLRSVPAPVRFGFEGIDAKGVSAREHRRAYYAAWAFVIQNVLPPMPENNYHHRQTPTGKPSLWAEGSSKAKASAAWESFFAQQLLAFILPECAWDAFEGIMMQVDGDGWLDGEVLPSRKAQTAWILHSHHGDKARLRNVYPPISRYLRWREKNPRWIYKEHDNPHQRDSNFVDSLLLDLDFAIRIAEELGEDAEEWRAMIVRVREKYVRWFFDDTLPHPVQYYYEDTGARDPGHATWVCSGLYLDGLPQVADEALLKLFETMYDPNRDLAGLDFCKHPIASMIAHGLFRRGRIKEAEGYVQAVLRDVIRTSRFSENYSVDPLRAWGVEDSMFGAATVIEFTLLCNGIRIDQGRPGPVYERTNRLPVLE